MHNRRFRQHLLIAFLAGLSALCNPASMLAQSAGRTFSIPVESLEAWSGKAVVQVRAKVLGHSAVHGVASDCEMHFGAAVSGYDGDPAGWVLEPMNLCIESPPTKFKTWIAFANSLNAATITVEGVPRIWPEHLVGGKPSNPDHVVEIHPVTRMKKASEEYKFTQFIYAPEGFEGGVSEDTADKILTSSTVTVVEDGGTVTITYKGRIGNFTTLDLDIDPSTIEPIAGGHRMRSTVAINNEKVPVKVLTVTGSEIDSAVEELATKRRPQTLGVLVLFSLDPEAVLKAAKTSRGNPVTVDNPLQLIAYGEPESQ